ncbi:MAG: Dihydrofolate reductase [Candidatus Nomurabacteria bacterium GW2011_GWA1_37_20]|uniref:Dihydrofolate reductase n=2 Tax=Parcubacteria group TaxID=1794811 RepID=A0A0G0KEP2_9BACT|nr:MAG: Dihydrofolate reductase [Parcubacteria group bacterium GW2011_GWC1_36_9]KKQ26760.1 MAG: Dihydrofolate reductase [Parcubacteria group bacterium GW2011_GWB1_37_13]KKQ32410.1 MAG: Dihydrofolate reductase [Candidatus Nomurabacteria bacterium GW2011_GWA1_37_20]KKQ47604.1 MAG: Dihydrofolate reductase [Candidatus Yanofskybacteria bacterium GW2011_GWC2_37_9]
MISLIAAIGKNNELGKNNTLVWSMPTDLKYFRKTTSGHPVIMGRKTFESIGRPMPNRRNIVITRDQNYKKDGIEVAHSLEEALNLVPHKKEEIFIIGGAEIYKQAMPIADKLYITHIEAEDKDADAFFPEIIPIVWNEISREERKKDEKNSFNYTFSVYKKFI